MAVPAMIEVVAGVLMQADGSYMLGSRPEGKSWAGYWEFPGGKVEAGESLLQALARELMEEMAIRVEQASYWMTREHHYQHASVRLHFFRVWAWQGQPVPQEGQRVHWVRPGCVAAEPMLPANGPVVKALSLPLDYAITCAGEVGEEAILAALARGTVPRMVQVREPGMSPAQLQRFCAAVAHRVHDAGGRVVVNADPALVAGWPVDGVHLGASALLALNARPAWEWVGCSVHSARDLRLAGQLGLDYALLGHVLPTQTHPDQPPLGWAGFQAIVEAARQPLPVYALGGLTRSSQRDALAHSAHGVAMMRAVWA